MEIRNMLRGENTSFASSRPAQKAEGKTAAVRPSTDRVELSRQWIETLEEQRARAQSALLNMGKKEGKDEGGLLGYMETEEDKLDVLSEHLKVQQKCLKIAMRIMQGKKVPPEDEQYLMENDPEGYKLAMAMRRPPKKDEEECESVLDDEDKNRTSDSSETGLEEASTVSTDGGGEAV